MTATKVRGVELAGVAEIAAEFGRNRPTVSMWASRRHSSGFPKPVAVLAMGSLYDMSAVRDWYTETYPGER